MASVVLESRPPEIRTTALLASRCITPEILVELDLKADPESILQDPIGQKSRIHLPAAGREQDLAIRGQAILFYLGLGPLVIPAIADHDLELIRRRERAKILIAILYLFPGTRGL